ncbi:hypothetical protein RUM43_004869 [Polyplax serrata]|uniref:Apyrase n=1 Tax=Polyplax serrata TaxID=468196 RepID=A0AAN8SCA9_POLSC
MSLDCRGNDNMKMSLRDWRQALESPPNYRIGKRTVRIQTKFVTIFVIFCIVVLFVRYLMSPKPSREEKYWESDFLVRPNIAPGYDNYITRENIVNHYNNTYPLTRPVRTATGLTYRIALVSDLDTSSKSQSETNVWLSHLQKGYLLWNPSLNSVSIMWDKSKVYLKSSLSQGGRGMELSELVVFNGKLYTMDDRTGVVYEIVGDEVVPWVILPDGDGRTSKTFKSEWATVKDQKLVVGGFGKEWTNPAGRVVNYNPQWIKTVTTKGEVSHKNWRDNYLALLKAVGITHPGYMIHESGMWSDIHKKWFFLPRRCSKETYHEETDELMGTNLLITCDENFQNIKVFKIGDVNPSHGFSSFKFIPGSEDEVIFAIKSEELKGSVSSYAMAFKINGKILMSETKIGDTKYEGIEFI